MVYNFHGLNYCIWNLNQQDFHKFKSTSSFNDELQSSFKGVETTKQTEAVGRAYSHPHNIMSTFKGFGSLQKMIDPDLTKQLNLIGSSNNKILVRSWANRMHYGACGGIHTHEYQNLERYVLLVYYSVPENSADLVFVNPARYVRTMVQQNLDDISESDKLVIKVSEGMCVLHDGQIPHGVSKHNSHQPREVLVFEFENLNLEGWQSG